MSETIFVLEYKPPREPGGSCFVHYNTSYKDGHFGQPLYSNGYYPIAILPDDILLNPEWSDYLDWVYAKTPSVKELTAALYSWIFYHAAEWHIFPIKTWN